MRENGFEPTIDDETRGKFTELRYLEDSIGRTALLALHPLLPMRRKALSQIYRLGDCARPLNRCGLNVRQLCAADLTLKAR